MNHASHAGNPLGPPVLLQGQVRYTGRIADRGYRLNRMFCSLTQAENRERFRDDSDAYMQACGLSEEEMNLVRNKDCVGMFRYGMNIYAVAKAGTILGVPLTEIGAAMKSSTEKEQA